MCYKLFSYFHHSAHLVVYVLLPRFVLSSQCTSGCLCVITTFRTFITVHLWLSMCYYHFLFFHHSAHPVVYVKTVRTFITVHLWLSMCYYHFLFFHHSAHPVVYVKTVRSFTTVHLWLSICYYHFSFLWCISGCLCLIITFLSFIKVRLWLSMRYYHYSCLNHGSPLVVYERVITTFCSFITVHHDEGLESANNIWTT